MIVARVKISGVAVTVTDKKTITSGMVGAKVQLEYVDPMWDSLDKLAVFYGAGVVKDGMTNETLVTIPAEVLARPNGNLLFGVQGVDANKIVVIPTLIADLGPIRVGAKPSGDTNTDTTLPPWAQVKAMIGDLSKLDTTAKENLVAAVNEALTKGGGGGAALEIDDTLTFKDGVLAVNTATAVEANNTLPITSAAVNTAVGNIEILLATI